MGSRASQAGHPYPAAYPMPSQLGTQEIFSKSDMKVLIPVGTGPPALKSAG